MSRRIRLTFTNFDSITGALESIGKKTANDELQNSEKADYSADPYDHAVLKNAYKTDK
jgi:hypothetical protein